MPPTGCSVPAAGSLVSTAAVGGISTVSQLFATHGERCVATRSLAFRFGEP